MTDERETQDIPEDVAAQAARPAQDDEVTGEVENGEPEQLFTRKDLDAVLLEAEDRRLRTLAEYDNFRRRTQREREQWIADALAGFVGDMLPVFDSLERARQAAGDDAGPVVEGLDVLQRQLATVLAKHSVEAVDPKGQPFDPRTQEAFSRLPTDAHPPGTVVEVFEKGYTIAGRLLRPARVIVASEPAAGEG